MEQVLEAALFVGGTPLTSKKLCALFRSEFDQDFIEALIDSLNCAYALEQRPYEIRFGEGGYRMVLREAYDDVRSRVFGHGPREVTLSQGRWRFSRSSRTSNRSRRTKSRRSARTPRGTSSGNCCGEN